MRQGRYQRGKEKAVGVDSYGLFCCAKREPITLDKTFELLYNSNIQMFCQVKWEKTMLVICDKTGIQFETDSKRVKNHPRISAFLNDANKDGRHYIGTYGKASGLLAEAKGHFDNIDELLNAVNEAYEAWKSGDAKAIVRVTNGMRIRQQKDASDRRDQINAILKQHGYRWKKEEIGSEDDWAGVGSLGAGIGEAVGYTWVLNAPDNREVSVSQAFREIGMKMPA